MKVLEKRFHLNGHTSGFRPQIHKLEPGYETPSFILAVKGLKARSTLKKKTTRPLACPGEIKSSYLAGEVTSRHIRIDG